MKYFLAAYDLGHRSPTGNYWVWHHPSLDAGLLSVALEAAKEAGFPESPNDWDANFLKGGFCRLTAQWLMVHRFYDGGYDNRGRPQRWVLLCGFVPADGSSGGEAARLLDSGIFAEWARRPLPLPVPTPAAFEADLPRGAGLRPQEAIFKQLAGGTRLTQIPLEEAAMLVALSPPEAAARFSVSGPADSARAEVWQRSRPAILPVTPTAATQPPVRQETPRRAASPAADSRPVDATTPAPNRDASGFRLPDFARLLSLAKVALVSLACGIVIQRCAHVWPENPKPQIVYVRDPRAQSVTEERPVRTPLPAEGSARKEDKPGPPQSRDPNRTVTVTPPKLKRNEHKKDSNDESALGRFLESLSGATPSPAVEKPASQGPPPTASPSDE